VKGWSNVTEAEILRLSGVREVRPAKVSGSDSQGAQGPVCGRKAKPNQREHDEQTKLFGMAEQARAAYPELALLNGSLNGVRLTIGQAKKAKAAGMRRGYPDLFLPVARGNYHGLYIELKAKGGRVQPEQKEWLQALREQGYYCSVCYGAMEAWDEIVNYLEGGAHESTYLR
jgi:hypothetical protein